MDAITPTHTRSNLMKQHPKARVTLKKKSLLLLRSQSVFASWTGSCCLWLFLTHYRDDPTSHYKWNNVWNKQGEQISLVVQWLKIHLPMQRTGVWSLVWKDPTYRGATKPVQQNYWAHALEPRSHSKRNQHTEKPIPQEERTCHCNEQDLWKQRRPSATENHHKQIFKFLKKKQGKPGTHSVT